MAGAAGAGTPLVVSAVPSLDGYVVAGETALTVPAGDPVALRAAVNRLLDDPELGSRLAAAALARGAAWTYGDY